MSIGNRIDDAVNKVYAGDNEGALFSVCSAIEATAKKEYGAGGRSNYKKFIHDNLELITGIAFDGKSISTLCLGYSHPELKHSKDGAYPFQDIVYHAIRCGFYHDAKMPEDIEFTSGGVISVMKGRLLLPQSLIYGLVVAIVVSPKNENETASENCMISFGDFSIPFTKLWGRRQEMLWLISVRKENLRIANAQNVNNNK